MDEQTKKSFDSYLKGLLEDLQTSIEFQEATNKIKKIILLYKLTGDKYEDMKRKDENALDERFREHWDCLELETYRKDGTSDTITDVLLAFGGPNIRLRLESKRESAELNYYRGGDHFSYSNFSRAEIDMLNSLFVID